MPAQTACKQVQAFAAGQQTKAVSGRKVSVARSAVVSDGGPARPAARTHVIHSVIHPWRLPPPPPCLAPHPLLPLPPSLQLRKAAGRRQLQCNASMLNTPVSISGVSRARPPRPPAPPYPHAIPRVDSLTYASCALPPAPTPPATPPAQPPPTPHASPARLAGRLARRLAPAPPCFNARPIRPLLTPPPTPPTPSLPAPPCRPPLMPSGRPRPL